MIERRHQIVHRGDKFESAERASLKPINANDVSRWNTATQTFIDNLYLPLLIRLIRATKSKSRTPTPKCHASVRKADESFVHHCSFADSIGN